MMEKSYLSGGMGRRTVFTAAAAVGLVAAAATDAHAQAPSTRQLAFGRLPTLAAVDYGIVVDNLAEGANNAAKLQQAIVDLTANGGGGTIRLPAGRIYVAGTITIPVDRHVQLEGEGISHSGGTRWGTVLFRDPAYTGEMISAVGTGTAGGTRCMVTLANLGVHGGGVAATLARFAYASELILDHVRFSNSGREALVLTQVWNALISNVFIHSSGSGEAVPAVVMDAPAPQGDGGNGLFWTNVQWEGNNGINLSINGSIVHHFTNCKWENASAVSWPLVQFQRVGAVTISSCWFFKGRKLTNERATGPLLRQLAPAVEGDGERRANIITGSTLSHWGDAQQYIDHQAGGLVVSANSFAGMPQVAYIDVAASVGAHDSVIGPNYGELPERMVRDRRPARQTNTDNGRVGAMAPSANGWVGAMVPLSINDGRISRFVPTRNMRVTGIGFHVATAGSSTVPFDVGIYDRALNRIASSGPTTGLLGATGKKRIGIPETLLVAGESYYVVASAGAISGAPPYVAAANFGSIALSQFMGTGPGLVEADAVGQIHPLPNSITPPGGSTTGFAFFLHED